MYKKKHCVEELTFRLELKVAILGKIAKFEMYSISFHTKKLKKPKLSESINRIIWLFGPRGVLKSYQVHKTGEYE